MPRPATPPDAKIRVRSVMRGIVQGVGFRPHVARTATGFAVTGFVGNDDESVFIEAQGAPAEVGAFLDTIVATLPALARVTAREDTPIGPLASEDAFTIVASRRAGGAVTLIPPDVAPCPDCLRELADPADRRYRYPFITCTNCGPRLSIITDVPYDRPATTMAGFPMCRACAAEYADPLDRRYHAQPISCFDCGPRLWLQRSSVHGDGAEIAGWDDAIAAARSLLANGAILAVKGIGGFTLFADARNPGAVEELRRRKHRPHKPFAVMAADAASAAAFAAFTPDQERALVSPQRPIVLCPQGPGYDLAPGVAPGLDDVGVMLPSAPLHVLLVAAGEVYVATSANTSGDPIVYRNEDALADLAGIVDAFLIHDRPIHVPVEDSVLMAVGEETWPVRRSRGYAPLPVRLGADDRSVLAVGGELKNTFAITRDGNAFLSAHIGDMGSWACQQAFERSVAQLMATHRRTPEVVAADLHPQYATRAWAERYADGHDVPLLGVQHHHAHALSLLAEHGLAGTPATCVVMDGTGYGTDETIWGGEILNVGADPLGYERAWHLPLFDLPGGDSAVWHPWKTALALLFACGIDSAGLPCALAAPPAERRLVESQLAHRVAVVATSSAGRVFDAVASLLAVRHDVTYEAQAAMELEAVARGCAHSEHTRATAEDVPALIATLVAGVRAGTPTACLARVFHAGLSGIVARAALAAMRTAGTQVVGLSGGVAQNRLLVADVRRELGHDAPKLIVHDVVPANDGGLSLGQALAGYRWLAREGGRP
ncbi:MAG: carbamoyltransferase HypF [Actinomycetia bacterium]|nr:carbamoyltransferase HypF [Actinomycetes bacterium]